MSLHAPHQSVKVTRRRLDISAKNKEARKNGLLCWGTRYALGVTQRIGGCATTGSLPIGVSPRILLNQFDLVAVWFFWQKKLTHTNQ